jgi:ubiquitin-like modifier-activating enzyme ATG7
MQVVPLEEYDQFFANVPPSVSHNLNRSTQPLKLKPVIQRTVRLIRLHYPTTLVGPSATCLPTYMLSALQPHQRPQLLRHRGTTHSPPAVEISIWHLLTGTASPTTSRLSAVGWEMKVQGKLGPRVVDLAPMMDPLVVCGISSSYSRSCSPCRY